jgi:gamma-glutamylcyclotransferase (GGCT)/AIG2-like uncharacterized protein YtfP
LYAQAVIHYVFSYGTLRQSNVQNALYGREIPTVEDSLPGYQLHWLTITDPDVIRTSGSDRHPILQRGKAEDSVSGARLELNEIELQQTDEYEVDDYERREVVLSSGITAWAYLEKE